MSLGNLHSDADADADADAAGVDVAAGAVVAGEPADQMPRLVVLLVMQRHLQSLHMLARHCRRDLQTGPGVDPYLSHEDQSRGIS